MEVEDAQAAAQEAHAHARQGPAAAQAEVSTCSGASSASKREVESRELGDKGRFDMDVGGENPEVSVPKKRMIAFADHRWQLGERVDTHSNDGHLGEGDASQWRSPRTSQWRTAGSTALT